MSTIDEGMKKKTMYVRYTGRNNWFATPGKVYRVNPRGLPSHVIHVETLYEIEETGYYLFKDDFEVLSATEVMLHKARKRSENYKNWKVQK